MQISYYFKITKVLNCPYNSIIYIHISLMNSFHDQLTIQIIFLKLTTIVIHNIMNNLLQSENIIKRYWKIRKSFFFKFLGKKTRYSPSAVQQVLSVPLQLLDNYTGYCVKLIEINCCTTLYIMIKRFWAIK